ncbi:retrieval of early ER protein Rer1, partial [Atractiella rhizophila]
MMLSEPPGDSGFQNLTDATSKYQRVRMSFYQITPYTIYRWIGTGTLLLLFMARVLLAQGWYIVCYVLGIHLLNLFLAFLQPKFDSSLEIDIAEPGLEDGAPTLPTSSQIDQDDEFRPFMRRLPEFKFWFSATQAIFISMVASFFKILNISVFWPILLFYFCIMFAIEMRARIAHMRKY